MRFSLPIYIKDVHMSRRIFPGAVAASYSALMKQRCSSASCVAIPELVTM